MDGATNDKFQWETLSKRRLALWSKLTHRRGREQSGQIIVEGVRQVTEALVSGVPIDGLVAVDPDGLASAERAIAQSGRTDWSLFRTDASSFTKLSGTVTSSGLVAIVSWVPRTADALGAAQHDRVLFCDAISDPGNLGTLIRTAAGLGCDAVAVGERSVEVTNAKVIRSTAGTIFRIPVYENCCVEDFLSWSEHQKLPIVVADLTADEELIPSLGSRWVAVIGGETRGLSPAWSDHEVTRLRITMQRGVESLNAAVAGAILIERLCRQEEKPPGSGAVE